MDKDLLGQQEVRDLCQRAVEAQRQFASASQAEVDKICGAMSKAGFRASRKLAELAVADTGMGRVEDKILKNEFATRDVWEFCKDLRTVGVIDHDRRTKHTVYAEPMGVIAGIIPTTNPTSTAVYKALIAVKSRNALVASPHPNAAECIIEALRIVAEAAEKAGAPKGLISCIAMPSIKAASALMKNENIALILSTGGSSIVRAAHSSGKPAIGVGPGNVPAFVDHTADVRKAINDVIIGKSFDWGTICSSEQALIVDRRIEKKVLDTIARTDIYWVKGAERALLEKFMVPSDGRLNTAVVGQSPAKIAQLAGFTAPENTQVLLVDQDGVGPEYPLSREKLSPVLAYYTVSDTEAGIALAARVIEYDGVGHTAVIHSSSQENIERFAERVRAFRVLANTPAPHGSVGYTTGLEPAMTLGCGTWGGAITGDNITPLHLINRKHLAIETDPVEPGGVIGSGRSIKGSYSRYDDVSPGSEGRSTVSEQDEQDGQIEENVITGLADKFRQELGN
ncbi:MAG: aldehyde dehydrogenase family protein [Candidatus Marinimicrobia bacterium]|nr:aldehyde dehydrogenase family protein [Candidatus Neomarinimicrobiota bacterium]